METGGSMEKGVRWVRDKRESPEWAPGQQRGCGGAGGCGNGLKKGHDSRRARAATVNVRRRHPILRRSLHLVTLLLGGD